MKAQWERLSACIDNQEVGSEAAILERVRNSSLVECAGAENVSGLKPSTEAVGMRNWGKSWEERGTTSLRQHHPYVRAMASYRDLEVYQWETRAGYGKKTNLPPGEAMASYRDLEVYQTGYRLALEVHHVTKTFPEDGTVRVDGPNAAGEPVHPGQLGGRMGNVQRSAISRTTWGTPWAAPMKWRCIWTLPEISATWTTTGIWSCSEATKSSPSACIACVKSDSPNKSEAEPLATGQPAQHRHAQGTAWSPARHRASPDLLLPTSSSNFSFGRGAFCQQRSQTGRTGGVGRSANVGMSSAKASEKLAHRKPKGS